MFFVVTVAFRDMTLAIIVQHNNNATRHAMYERKKRKRESEHSMSRDQKKKSPCPSSGFSCMIAMCWTGGLN